MVDLVNPFSTAWKNVRRARKTVTDHNLKVCSALIPERSVMLDHAVIGSLVAVHAQRRTLVQQMGSRVHQQTRKRTAIVMSAVLVRLRCRAKGSSLEGCWWSARVMAAWCTRTKSRRSVTTRLSPRCGPCLASVLQQRRDHRFQCSPRRQHCMTGPAALTAKVGNFPLYPHACRCWRQQRQPPSEPSGPNLRPVIPRMMWQYATRLGHWSAACTLFVQLLYIHCPEYRCQRCAPAAVQLQQCHTCDHSNRTMLVTILRWSGRLAAGPRHIPGMFETQCGRYPDACKLRLSDNIDSSQTRQARSDCHAIHAQHRTSAGSPSLICCT
jgi:hypothetical protein